MTDVSFLAEDGQAVVVAIDHPLYSWPCRGLEDRERILRQVSSAGADAIIASYGTIRDLKSAFGRAAPILKLDVSNVGMSAMPAEGEHVLGWSVDDALHLEVQAVLTRILLGTAFELQSLRTAARVAAQCDRQGIAYVCEILAVESDAYPAPAAPEATALAARVGAELGAHVIETSMPVPAAAVAEAVACGVPLILAGGELTNDRNRLLQDVKTAIEQGAAGVAFGRNVWGARDPAGMVLNLCDIVHPARKDVGS